MESRKKKAPRSPALAAWDPTGGFSCDGCTKTFKYRAALCNHVRSFHQDAATVNRVEELTQETSETVTVTAVVSSSTQLPSSEIAGTSAVNVPVATTSLHSSDGNLIPFFCDESWEQYLQPTIDAADDFGDLITLDVGLFDALDPSVPTTSPVLDASAVEQPASWMSDTNIALRMFHEARHLSVADIRPPSERFLDVQNRFGVPAARLDAMSFSPRSAVFSPTVQRIARQLLQSSHFSTT